MQWSQSAAGLAAALALSASFPAAQSAAPNAGPGGPVAVPTAQPPAAAGIQGPNAQHAPAGKRSARPSSDAAKGGVMTILVYDQNTNNGFAATAAQNLSFFGTTIADASNFNTLLTTGTWDAVAVDCPSTIPTGGWTSLVNYVNGGGEAILSFWDWDNTAAYPTLGGAFDVSVSSSISLVGQTLFDSGTSPAFLGVTMPNSSWNDNWIDDGDQFNLLAGAQGMAHIGTATTPVLVRGNAGRTIAGPVFDEAGPVWIGDGSAVQLWENMILMISTPGPSILVYDNDSEHKLAQLAAFETSPGGTQIADATTFNGLLAGVGGGPWEAVLVDCPNFDPNGGWVSLIAYVNGGGHVAMSFWDWDNDLGFGDPALTGAFDVSVISSFSLVGQTLFDSGLTDLFAGVPMPNNSWHDHWNDDGDRFAPLGQAKGLAHIGNPAQPVIVYGNAGRTLAAPVLDEAGDVWLSLGSGVVLWKNMLSAITEPDASCTFRNGVLGLNPSDYTCITPPVVGGTWVASVDTLPGIGTLTLTTFVTIGIGGPIVGIPIFGHELLILPPFVQTTGLGIHNIPMPSDPTLVGVEVPSQGARIELGGGGQIHVILTNAQDLVLGF